MITFLLLLTGILLIFINYRALKKDNTDFKQAFSSASKNIKDYDLEIAKLRSEYAENILEIQQEIEALKDELGEKYESGALKQSETEQLELPEAENIDDEEVEAITELDMEQAQELADEQENDQQPQKEASNNIKVNEIEKLLNEGLSIDLICEKLGIGKGEVLLIEKLYLKSKVF